MQIRKCPCCVSYIHFDYKTGLTRCWNCRTLTDFSKLKTTSQRIAESVSIPFSELFYHSIPFNGRGKWNRIALLTALPVALLMLLVSNSLDVNIVHDMSLPFSRWVETFHLG